MNPDERVPLLPPPKPRPKVSRRPRSVACTVLVALLSLLLALLTFIALLGASFYPTKDEIDSLKSTFHYAIPTDISVVNITEAGVLADVVVRCGIDMDRAMAVRLSDIEAKHAAKLGFRGAGAAWWESIRSRVVDVAGSYIPRHVRLELDRIDVSTNGTALAIATVTPIHVPIVQQAQGDWLQPMPMRVLAKPTASMDTLWKLLQGAWETELANVSVATTVKYGSYQKAVELPILLKVPRIPDVAKLVHLEDYTLHTDTALLLEARASVHNPIPVNITLPAVPVAAFLGKQKMAEVITDPVSLAASHLNVTMAGHVAQLDSSALSAFLQNYLHGIDTPITVKGLGFIPSFSNTTLPQWVLQALSSVSAPLIFPGPRPPPKVIHSVTIEHMRITPGSRIYASGTVIAQIDLPRGMEHMDVDVTGVLPDVVIYDGPVEDCKPFGHIKPEEYLNSTTSKGEDVFNPDRLTVRAPIESVPVQILQGKDRVLSDFVRRIVFKGGALAGIDGNASVIAQITGVRHSVQLDDLPVRGETWVGR